MKINCLLLGMMLTVSSLSNAQKNSCELFTTSFLNPNKKKTSHLSSDTQNNQTRLGQTNLFSLDSIITSFSDEEGLTNQLFFDYKRRYIYDSLNRNIINIYSGWDDSLGVWEIEEKEEMLYDLNGNLVQTSYFEWDAELEIWPNADYKNEFTYDSQGNLVQDVSYSFEDSTWINAEKKEYSYDANNNRILELNFYGNSNDWDSTYKRVMSYDTNNNEIELVMSGYTNHAWENMNKQEHDYNSINNVTEYRAFNWNNDDSSWNINHEKIIYNYNQNNNLIEQIEYNFTSDSTLENNSKIEYIFDANENLSEEIYFSWEEVDSVWRSSSKISLTFNTNYSFENLILPLELSEQSLYFRNMLTSFVEYEFEEDSNSWLLNEQLSLHYSEIISPVDTTFITSCEPFPWGGNTLDTSGIYLDTLQNIFGNDSLVILDLTIYDPVIANASPTNSSICLNDSILLTASGGVTYNWEPSEFIEHSDSATVTVFPNESMDFTLEVVDTNGCTGYDTVSIDVSEISVTISILGDSLVAYISQEAESIYWNTGDETSSILVDSSGIYIITVTNEIGCDASDTIIFENVSTNILNYNPNMIELFPNPTNNYINIFTENLLIPNELSSKKFLFELFDHNGQIVLNKFININESLDLSKLNKGIYIYKYHLNEEIRSGKIIKN